MTREGEKIVDDFVEFLICELCEGCNECDPRLPEESKPLVVCMNKGWTKWFLHNAEKYKKNRKESVN